MADITALKKIITGKVDVNDTTLDAYSRDASLFEVRPEAVVYPVDTSDVQAIVRFVSEHKAKDPTLSITARSAGTDMSGGPINESIIIDFVKEMNAVVGSSDDSITVQPGLYYRDFEKVASARNMMMPAYTASKGICAIGGMIGNNSGGEKTIKYGKVERYVRRQKVVFADGNEYEVKPLSEKELKTKMAQGDFEGSIYKNLFNLIKKNKDIIDAAKPQVSKNSAGYYLWNVWDEKTGVFDINKLIVGAQGTLGITTEVELGLVPIPTYSRMVVMYMPSIERLGGIVDTIMTYNPESFESYDDYSMKLAITYAFDFFRVLGFWQAIRLGLQFIPDMITVLRGGMPKLILMVEVTGDDEDSVLARAHEIKQAVSHFGYQTHIATSAAEVEKYWKIRRESFNLLRNHVKGKRTAPFIDDIIVSPHHMPVFLPKLQTILDEYKLVYTIAGHAGNGNFHIIPLMDLDNPISSDIILQLSKKVYRLVSEYKGSITAEHNDGIIRTPFLSYMYTPEVLALFAETKRIFDPQGIFNPGKKVGGSFDYIKAHIIQSHPKHPYAS